MDGSCVRLRAEHTNHVWSYDFVHHRTDDGKVFRTLNILDEFSRECLAIRIKRKVNSTDVIDALTDLFISRGVPAFIRSPYRRRFACLSSNAWENGYIESFNARLRDELLNGEIFYSVKEAQIVIEQWRIHYNTKRPHSSLVYKPPAPESIIHLHERIAVN